ncbi:MAG: type 4a pilus biogenesis protein PilO [Halothiobacillaceae bacterium]
MDLIEEIRTLDYKNIGSASLALRIIILLLVLAALVGAGIYFDTQPLREELARSEAVEPGLRDEVKTKQKKAANLEALEAQLEEMQVRFSELLRQLPNRSEAENLIDNVAETSLSNGMRNRQIQPGSERRHEFYAEMPYTLRLEGGFHELARFMSDTAQLPRIVTLHNPSISLGSEGSPRDRAENLQISVTARTYRYLEDGEDDQ